MVEEEEVVEAWLVSSEDAVASPRAAYQGLLEMVPLRSRRTQSSGGAFLPSDCTLPLALGGHRVG